MSSTDNWQKDLRYLRDIEEIKRLKYDYCYHGDRLPGARNAPEKMAACFADDGVWELIPGVRGVGPAEIEAAIRRMGQYFSTTLHIPMLPRIDIQGDHAKGSYDKLLPCAADQVDDMTQPLWSIGQYREEYVRTPKGWRIQMINHVSQFVPTFHPSLLPQP